MTKAKGVLPEVALRVKSAGRQVMGRKRARPGKAEAEEEYQGTERQQKRQDGAAGQAAAASTESVAPAVRGKDIALPKKKLPDKKLLALLSKRRVK